MKRRKTMKKRNTIKKNISILLALTLLCMVIAGCGKTSSSNTDAPSAEAPSDSQDAATEAAEDTSLLFCTVRHNIPPESKIIIKSIL
jgi:uncharacterized lipoprotein YajG